MRRSVTSAARPMTPATKVAAPQRTFGGGAAPQVTTIAASRRAQRCDPSSAVPVEPAQPTDA